jgi:hypothetical protein
VLCDVRLVHRYLTDASVPRPEAGRVAVVFFWGKQYQGGYKFMPLYSKLQADLPEARVVGVSVCAHPPARSAQSSVSSRCRMHGDHSSVS